MIAHPWGFKQKAAEDESASGLGGRADRLFVVPHGHCSIHRHARIVHLFHLVSGEAWVDFYADVLPVSGSAPLRSVAIPGFPRLVAVNPGVIHRFRAGGEGAVIEEISLDWSEGDIERFSEGGIGR